MNLTGEGWRHLAAGGLSGLLMAVFVTRFPAVGLLGALAVGLVIGTMIGLVLRLLFGPVQRKS